MIFKYDFDEIQVDYFLIVNLENYVENCSISGVYMTKCNEF